MDSQYSKRGSMESYGYVFESAKRRFLFIRKFGAGAESVAQLVRDMDSGENLIRKVSANRLVRKLTSDSNRQPKKPREFIMLDAIRHTFNPSPKFPFYLVDYNNHEYIKSNDTDPLGNPKYHSVSYWKLCNGRAVRTQWLTGHVHPPITAVARMVRQVLSTLHYLYTGGAQPIYHEDVHLGNVWMHWEADGALPDFYLGDFADASFADSKYTCLTLEEKVLVGRPVNDLHKFWLGLTLVVDMVGERRGHRSPGVLALRRLAAEMSAVVTSWKEASDTDAPPDLSELICCAERVEADFGKGGVTDETGTVDYVKFVTVERNKALKVEREGAMVVRTRRKEQALRPMDTSAVGSVSVPLAIHGPWRLFKSVDGKWVPAEGPGVTHHRPNRVQVGDGELSNTKKAPGLFAPVFMELEGSDKDDSGASVASHSQYSSGQKTIRPPSLSTNLSSQSLALSPVNNSLATGDDASIQEARPDNVSEISPTFSWAEGDDGEFEAACSLSSSMATDLPPFNWQLTFRDGARLAAAQESVLQVSKKQPSTRKGGKKTTSVVPEQIEDTLRLWHALVHGASCECRQEVWMDAVEATLRGVRMRRVLKGPKLASLSLDDPKF